MQVDLSRLNSTTGGALEEEEAEEEEKETSFQASSAYVAVNLISDGKSQDHKKHSAQETPEFELYSQTGEAVLRSEEPQS